MNSQRRGKTGIIILGRPGSLYGEKNLKNSLRFCDTDRYFEYFLRAWEVYGTVNPTTNGQ